MKRYLFIGLFLFISSIGFAQKRIVGTNRELQKFCADYIGHIRNDQRKLVALCISYPLEVTVGDKKMQIKDFLSFLKVYDSVFYPAFKRIILNGSFSDYHYIDGYLCTSYGELFICSSDNPESEGTKYKIYAVNNDPVLFYTKGIFK